MKKLIGTKDFYKKVLLIAIPMMIQNGITNFVSMLDNLMVGQIGTNEMSGVAIVNQLMFVYYITIFGAISGAGIFGAQFFGKGNHEGMMHTFRFKIYMSAFVVVVAVLLFWFKGEALISLYLHEGSDIGDIALTLNFAKGYLLISLLGLIPFAVTQIYAGTLRETGQTIVPMQAGIVAVLVNTVFNYIFIFGNFGAPRLGARGAAIATVIARFIEMGIVIVWTHRHKERNKFIVGAYRSMKIPMVLAKDIFIKGTPLMINELLWASGVAVITQCYAFRGLVVVAALNITSTISNVFNIAFIALGSSVSIIVGQMLGADKKAEAKDSAAKIVAFSVAASVVMGLFMVCFSKVFPLIYNTEDAVKEMATIFIVIAGLVMPLQAFTHAAYFTLRSGGKTWITFIFDSLFVWSIVIPFAYFLARYTGWPISVVYLTVQFTEIIKCIIGFIMIKRGSWVQNIVNY